MAGVEYQQGNPVTIVETFFDADGSTPEDPDDVTVRLRQPDDTLLTFLYGTDPEVTRLSAGVYQFAFGVPSQVYEYHGDFVGTLASSVNWTLPFDFYVIPSSVVPDADPVGPRMPPCQAWISGDDITCNGSDALSKQQRDALAVMASMLMYELSGRQFSGLCGPVTVRPCQASCGRTWGWGTGGWSWSWGYWSGAWGYGWFWGNEGGPRRCSCGYDSVIEIAGYPVTEITEVKINGQVLAPTFTDGSPTYRLDQWRYLTRLADPDQRDFPLHWPFCQRLDLQDDQPGTFSVSYRYGVPPPPLGIEAAKQIACQLMLAQSGQACTIPAKVTRIVRQGSTLDMVTPVAAILRAGGTGLFLVDSFIAAYNPNGLRRRPSVFSPDLPYPVRVGNE